MVACTVCRLDLSDLPSIRQFAREQQQQLQQQKQPLKVLVNNAGQEAVLVVLMGSQLHL